MARNRVFTPNAWKDYLYWQEHGKSTLKKVNALIEDVCRNGNEGLGKPEPLAGDLAGYWSRRITDKDRLVYRVTDTSAFFIACRSHYDDK